MLPTTCLCTNDDICINCFFNRTHTHREHFAQWAQDEDDENQPPQQVTAQTYQLAPLMMPEDDDQQEQPDADDGIMDITEENDQDAPPANKRHRQ
jgi:hypothetical protein